MPIITVKVFEDELDPKHTASLIHDLTEATIPYVGEVVRANTWVLIEEIKSGSWGIGGKALGLPDLREIQRNAPSGQQPRDFAALDAKGDKP